MARRAVLVETYEPGTVNVQPSLAGKDVQRDGCCHVWQWAPSCRLWTCHCVSRQASLLWVQLLATFPQGTRMALQRLVEG